MKKLLSVITIFVISISTFAQDRISQKPIDMSGKWAGKGIMKVFKEDKVISSKYDTVAVNHWEENAHVLTENYVWEDGRKNNYKFVLRFQGNEFTIDPSQPGEYPQFSEAIGHCSETGKILPAGKSFCHHVRYMKDGTTFQALITKDDEKHLNIVRMQSLNGKMITTMESTYEKVD